MRRLTLFGVAIVCAQLTACSSITSSSRWTHASAATLQPPPVREQFRGVWVATVANIDWPTTPGSPKAAQLAEIDTILDRVQRTGFNAVFLQVRPTADAVYRSDLEPASAFISGKQGLDPGYDPLTQWIDRAHARGLELHAWFNPFRTAHPESIGRNAPTHINRTNPELVRAHGPYKWADPGELRARLHFLRVVEDVVNRYEIDGVHIDDYFYPYPRSGTKAGEFDDQTTYERYLATTTPPGTEKLDKAAWRRSNTDSLVHDLYTLVKRLDPSVTVSVSPFGIWRPEHPPGIKGMDAYDTIASDSRRWLREGWVDALIPQLYWPIDKPDQSFTALLGWWDQQNILARHLWPGINIARDQSKFPGWLDHEIPRQIQALPSHHASGMVMFSARILSQHPNFTSTLASTSFAQPAVVPDSPWLALPAQTITATITTNASGDRLRVRTSSDPIRWVLLRKRATGQWHTTTEPGTQREFALSPTDRAVMIQGVFRSGQRSNRVGFQRRN